MKVCTKCGKRKHNYSFYKTPQQSDGLSSYCKRCMSDYSKEKREYKPRPYRYRVKKIRNGVYAVLEKGFAVKTFNTLEEAKHFAYPNRYKIPEKVDITQNVLDNVGESLEVELIGGKS